MSHHKTNRRKYGRLVVVGIEFGDERLAFNHRSDDTEIIYTQW